MCAFLLYGGCLSDSISTKEFGGIVCFSFWNNESLLLTFSRFQRNGCGIVEEVRHHLCLDQV